MASGLPAKKDILGLLPEQYSQFSIAWIVRIVDKIDADSTNPPAVESSSNARRSVD